MNHIRIYFERSGDLGMGHLHCGEIRQGAIPPQNDPLHLLLREPALLKFYGSQLQVGVALGAVLEVRMGVDLPFIFNILFTHFYDSVLEQ